MSLDPFWAAIDHQIERLTHATTVDQVLEICPQIPGTSSGDGFFAGGGGDASVLDALHDAGWETVQIRAWYYWCMRAPTGELLSYVEGDLYRGNQLVRGGS